MSDDSYLNVIANLVARNNTTKAKKVHPPNQLIMYVMVHKFHIL